MTTRSDARSRATRKRLFWLTAMMGVAGCGTVPADAKTAASSSTEQGEYNASVGEPGRRTPVKPAADPPVVQPPRVVELDAGPTKSGDAGVLDSSAPMGDAPANGRDCADEEAAALAVLQSRCASCHANGRRDGGFGDALDLSAIVADGLVVPGDAQRSELVRITSNGKMPLGGPRLSAAEQQALADWITCEGTLAPPAGGGGGGVDVGGGGNAGGGNAGGDEEDHDDDDDGEVDDD